MDIQITEEQLLIKEEVIGNLPSSYINIKEELELETYDPSIAFALPDVNEVTIKDDPEPLPTEEIYLKDEFATHRRELSGMSQLNNSYVCDECNYQSMDITKLKTHLVLHIKDKPFRCRECEYETLSKFSLTLHIVNEHSSVVVCSQCKFTSTAQYDMDEHMKTHTVAVEEHMKILAAEKPFKCNQCEYRSAKEYFIEKHMITHSPENCFKCTKCDFSTLLKCKLQKHMKSHRKRKAVVQDVD